MNKDILAGVKLEGQELDEEGNLQPKFAEQPEPDEKEKETPPSSPEEEKTEEEQKVDTPPTNEKPEELQEKKEGEKEVPFHQHPRWKQVYNELQELRDFKEQIMPLIQSIQKEEKKEDEEIPQWFQTLFGTDENAWNQYRDFDNRQRQAIKNEILESIDAKQKQISEESKKYDKWVDDQISQLEDDGLKFDRNKLMKVAIDYLPTDSGGNISFRKAYSIMKAMETQKIEQPKPELKSQERKKIVDLKELGGESEKKDYMTPEDFKGKSVHDLIHE